MDEGKLSANQISTMHEASLELLDAVREAAVQTKHAGAAGGAQAYAAAARDLAEAFVALYGD